MALDLLIVSRDEFFVKHYRYGSRVKAILIGRYPCTVGAVGTATPGGAYKITYKTPTPDWKVPDSVVSDNVKPGDIVPFYIRDDAGELVLDEGGFPIENPENPFAGGFVSIYDGVGLHATKFPPQTGTRASHGCIRLELDDFLELYRRVEIGTPIYIA